MSPEAEKYIALLDRRLSLLRALAGQFIACRQEFVAMDRDGMYSRIAEQEELCRQIESIRLPIDALGKACAGQLALERRDLPQSVQDAAWFDRLGSLKGNCGKRRQKSVG